MHIQQHFFLYSPCNLGRASRLPGPCPAAPSMIPVAARDALTAASRKKMHTRFFDVISEGLEGAFVDGPQCEFLGLARLHHGALISVFQESLIDHCEVVTSKPFLWRTIA